MKEMSFSPASLLGAVVVLLLFFLLTFISQKQRPGPPGPTALPILGNLLQLDLRRPDKTFMEFSKKYGSVFTVYLGSKEVVVLTGYKTIKEALIKNSEAFGERDAPTIVKEANLDHGIIWGNGESWKELRRFAFTNLKDFGMGRRACEDKIIEESQHLIQEFKTFNDEALDTTRLINHAVSNIICSMVYGSRFDYEDPEFQTIVNQTTTRLHLLGTPQIQLYNLFPTIGKLLFPARRKMGHIVAAIRKNHLKLLNHLKESLNPQRCRGVADAFLVCQQQLEVRNSR